MIRERQVKGPLQTVEHNGKEYAIEYRRRYYERETHFTLVEIELSPRNWIESDAFQTGQQRLTKQIVRQIVAETIDQHHKRREQL